MWRLAAVRSLASVANAAFRLNRVTIQGSKMVVDPADFELMIHGVHEPFVTELFKRLLKPGGTVVDAGAYTGYFTLLASRLVGEGGRVLSFEPNPRSRLLLERNLKLNKIGNVRVFSEALSDRAGDANLFVCQTNEVFNSLTFRRSYHSGLSTRVMTTSLDTVLERCGWHTDLVKMDVEGSEANSLTGMRRTIRNNPDLIIVTEFWPEALRASGSDPLAYLRSLRDQDFAVYNIQENLRRIDLQDDSSFVAECDQRNREHANLLCVKGRTVGVVTSTW